MPYEATFPRVMARIGAWVRGAARLYRRPLLVAVAAAATLAVGVAAGQAPEAVPGIAPEAVPGIAPAAVPGALAASR